jgi:LmbE family N-acetylglucosaminyl deacetylase
VEAVAHGDVGHRSGDLDADTGVLERDRAWRAGAGRSGDHHRRMRSEAELVPYSAGRLDGSPLLALAPHPDDEVFGCGGALLQAARSGADVRVVVVTDGGAQGGVSVRREESRAAARRLGLPEPVFWGFADRSLEAADPDLVYRVRSLLLEVGPRLILVPSPAEVHPERRALALAAYRVLQEALPGTDLHAALQSARLVAYEVAAVLRPNLLLDVTDEWEDILAAAKCCSTQVAAHPCVEVLDAVATARRLTLPPSVRRAEAYFVADLRFVRAHSAAEWAATQGPSANLEPTGRAAPLDVVVRTRNRPHLLREALASLLAQLLPPARVVVVNDGGVPVGETCRSAAERLALKLVELPESRGRSAAAMVGLEQATASHVVFLDDDDLLLPEHLLVLGRAVADGVSVPYTDAIQGIWTRDGCGELVPVGRHRTFGGPFEPARLALVNHIPLPTVAVPRRLALEVGGFAPALDLYEDWDLLLRLAARTPFVHLPLVTVEYRVIPDAGSITGGAPPGSPRQLEALAAIWGRHALLEVPERLAAAVMALLAERDRSSEQARNLDEQLLETRGTADGIQGELQRTRAAHQQLEAKAEELGASLAAAEHLRSQTETRLAAAAAEVARLNDLLQNLYRTRTWKAHAFLKRLRGR